MVYILSRHFIKNRVSLVLKTKFLRHSHCVWSNFNKFQNVHPFVTIFCCHKIFNMLPLTQNDTENSMKIKNQLKKEHFLYTLFYILLISLKACRKVRCYAHRNFKKFENNPLIYGLVWIYFPLLKGPQPNIQVCIGFQFFPIILCL